MKLYYDLKIETYSFEEVILNYKKISFDLSSKITKNHIEQYIKSGFYPYARDFEEKVFYEKIFNTLEKVILEDLPSFANFQSSTLIKVKKIFYFIANTLP
jgi:predicted AAA+ superfamily ATPase